MRNCRRQTKQYFIKTQRRDRTSAPVPFIHRVRSPGSRKVMYEKQFLTFLLYKRCGIRAIKNGNRERVDKEENEKLKGWLM